MTMRSVCLSLATSTIFSAGTPISVNASKGTPASSTRFRGPRNC